MPKFRIWRALAAFVVSGAVAWPLVYVVAITLSPNVTGDGHPVMPIGQVLVATVLAPVIAAVTAYLVGRPPRR